ncbi:MAG: hypothetical protein LVR00_06745 [Rhabdochlamydiaceae bacterium]|jgi:hypothetical protein
MLATIESGLSGIERLLTPLHYRMCNQEDTLMQRIGGLFVMQIAALATGWVVPKITFPPLLNRISFNVPVGLLEASKCVGWVFTAQYVYGVALSLLLGRSWLVKAVVLGTYQALVSSLIKRAITAIFWSRHARELDATKTEWKEFLGKDKIIPPRWTVHWRFKEALFSFFANLQKWRDSLRKESKTLLESMDPTDNGYRRCEGRIRELDQLDWVLNLLRGRFHDRSGTEFEQNQEIIRKMLFEGLEICMEAKDTQVLLLLESQYRVLLEMQQMVDSIENAHQSISKENDKNLKTICSFFGNMEANEEWQLVSPIVQARLSKMKEAVERTQLKEGYISMETFHQSPMWDEMRETAELVNGAETFPMQDWWGPINDAVKQMKSARDKYLAYRLLNNWSREEIEGFLSGVSSLSLSSRFIISMLIEQSVFGLFTRYPALSSFPILVDAMTNLVSEFMGQLFSPPLSYTTKTLGNVQPLQDVLQPLEEVMGNMAKLQADFDAILCSKATDLV